MVTWGVPFEQLAVAAVSQLARGSHPRLSAEFQLPPGAVGSIMLMQPLRHVLNLKLSPINTSLIT